MHKPEIKEATEARVSTPERIAGYGIVGAAAVGTVASVFTVVGGFEGDTEIIEYIQPSPWKIAVVAGLASIHPLAKVIARYSNRSTDSN